MKSNDRVETIKELKIWRSELLRDYKKGLIDRNELMRQHAEIMRLCINYDISVKELW